MTECRASCRGNARSAFAALDYYMVDSRWQLPSLRILSADVLYP
ncbi:hypothetical protein Pd630_LPD03585 [Rhodococcus opacus PD630]|nr:hypothetical protein Pd630_LPD03585 [Rhodococcus opacus PD630]